MNCVRSAAVTAILFAEAVADIGFKLCSTGQRHSNRQHIADLVVAAEFAD